MGFGKEEIESDLMEQQTAEAKTNWDANKKISWGLKEKLFLLLIVSGLAVFAGQSFEDSVRQVVPEKEVFRSVVNKKESGLSALLTIAEKSGLPCQMWLVPYRRLGNTKGLLYIVQPNQPLTPSEVKEILDWVHQGNELVYFDSFFRKQKKRHVQSKEKWVVDNENALLQKLGLSVELLANHVNHVAVDSSHLPELAHVKKLLLKGDVKIIGGQPIVACKDGAYITSVKYGSGRILLGSVPELCANETLAEVSNYDNFQFMINCFRTASGAILFDEYCHGIQGKGNVFVCLSRRLPGLIFLQLLFMFIPAEIATRQRFGALKTTKISRQISDLAYIFGLANLYKRAQANLVALEIIVGFWKTKLCRQLGLSARASKEEILQSAKDSNIDSEGNFTKFFNDYEQALSENEVSKVELTHLIKQCDSLDIKVRK